MGSTNDFAFGDYLPTALLACLICLPNIGPRDVFLGLEALVIVAVPAVPLPAETVTVRFFLALVMPITIPTIITAIMSKPTIPA